MGAAAIQGKRQPHPAFVPVGIILVPFHERKYEPACDFCPAANHTTRPRTSHLSSSSSRKAVPRSQKPKAKKFMEPLGDSWYEFEFAGQQIHVIQVDNQKSLAVMKDLVKGCKMLGMDTETKPVFQRNAERQAPALLQIAVQIKSQEQSTRNIVFLIDLLALLPVYRNKLDRILLPLFQDPECLVLGVNHHQDLRELVLSYPYCQSFHVITSSLDMSRIAGQSKTSSLQSLVSTHLYQELPKGQAASNWARRPLTPAQIVYAAKDAMALVFVYLVGGSEAFCLAEDMDGREYFVYECPECHMEFESRTKFSRYCREDCGMDDVPKAIKHTRMREFVEYE